MLIVVVGTLRDTVWETAVTAVLMLGTTGQVTIVPDWSIAGVDTLLEVDVLVKGDAVISCSADEEGMVTTALCIPVTQPEQYQGLLLQFIVELLLLVHFL